VSVSPSFAKKPVEEYRLTINFSCDPARTQDLVKALFEEIGRFRSSGPSPGQIADMQAALRRDLETDSQQNGYVLSQVAFAYQYDEPVPDVASLRSLYDSLSPSALREAAATYLSLNRYVKVVLYPEGK
jgi:zinc protease